MNDQPTIFPHNVTVRVSNVSDGTMTLRSLPENPDEVWQNREKFITANGGDIENTALVYVTYDGTRTYDEYKRAEAVGRKLSTTADDIADGLATTQLGLGMFLPIADCCAVVLYDTKNGALMLSHIGRHSVEAYGAQKSLDFMKAEYGSQPKDILAWLSPAVGQETYPVIKREHKGLKELIAADLRDAGVLEQNIEISPIDTAVDVGYFSNSQYQKGNRALDGRFAVYASLKEPN